tara:strand:- start:16 stop:117 length:102 start_codon:yes stop_codon:yes gene_type:complete
MIVKKDGKGRDGRCACKVIQEGLKNLGGMENEK